MLIITPHIRNVSLCTTRCMKDTFDELTQMHLITPPILLGSYIYSVAHSTKNILFHAWLLDWLQQINTTTTLTSLKDHSFFPLPYFRQIMVFWFQFSMSAWFINDNLVKHRIKLKPVIFSLYLPLSNNSILTTIEKKEVNGSLNTDI